MTRLAADMLPAAMLGLFIAIPFGPICLMCVQRTLALGIWFGIASGMGAAVAHGLFSFLAEASAAVLAQTALAAQGPLRMAGGLALIVMGLRTCLAPMRSARSKVWRPVLRLHVDVAGCGRQPDDHAAVY